MTVRVAGSSGSNWLTFAAFLSFVAAAIHIAAIIGGGDWYRFFGAGEDMARAAERGSVVPHLMTLAIAAMLTVWGLYALSGAGRFPRLPLLRTGLIVISAIYLLRGLVIVPAFIVNGANVQPFILWSSLIVLVYGLAYVVGTWRAWSKLDPASA